MTRGRAALLRGTALVTVLVLLAAAGAWVLQSSIPRTIAIATGPEALDDKVFPRYRDIVARDLASRTGTLPIDEWLAKLDRLEASAARVRTPASYASEAYTLREHIALVRRSVLEKSHAGQAVELAAP